MAATNKVTYKIKNLSDAPISFVGLHTLTIPGASEAEYSLSEAAWKKLLPRIRAKKTLVVTKVTGAADTAATTSTTKATTSTTSTKTSSTKTSTKAATKDTASTASSDTTSTDAATDTSTDATTSTKEG